MSKKIVIALSSFLVIATTMLTAGCEHHLIDIHDVQKARNYDELKYLIGDIFCSKSENVMKCNYYYNSFNMFLLNSQSQVFKFVIDSCGDISEKYLNETHTQYHIFPQTELPNKFSEFK